MMTSDLIAARHVPGAMSRMRYWLDVSPAMLMLASGSPRRRDLLAAAGERFAVRPSTVDEERLLVSTPQPTSLHLVRLLAQAKARDVADQIDAEGIAQPTIVLGADTVVESDGDVLGKPKSPDDARRMLMRLAGRWHTVATGVTLIGLHHTSLTRREVATVVVADVCMRPYTIADIDAYVQTGEPLDKAGAYAVQGRGADLVQEYRGDLTTIVGLPMSVVTRLLAEMRRDLAAE